MLPIEPLGLTASQWRFLESPEKYKEASDRAGRNLVLESTRRQFATARDILERLNGSYGEDPRRGVLLADDVGLGKTTVAAIVAWIVASAGEKRGVRILAPNDVMVRRWEEELRAHLGPLQECAPFLDVRRSRVKARRVGRPSAGSIQVVKHSYAASDFNLTCDLLIVDEAHRAKGENTAFSKALKRQKKHARRVLILTATPFSIRLEELQRMLTLIGGDTARGPVGVFSRALDDLYSGNSARSQAVVAERLAIKAQAAVAALSSCVIRHGIDDLPSEHDAFGSRTDWGVKVPHARIEEIELMLRMDRALRVARVEGSELSRATNDPRFHVGWRYVDEVRKALEGDDTLSAGTTRAVVENHLQTVRRLRTRVGTHSKMEAVGMAVRSKVEEGEKVILFCHHHATAQELTVHLASVLPCQAAPGCPGVSGWCDAWNEVLETPLDEPLHDERLRATFIKWLCCDPIRTQTWNWIGASSSGSTDLAKAFLTVHARHGHETIKDAAQALYRALLGSKSSRAVLKAAEDKDRFPFLPGANGAARVLGVCTLSNRREAPFFIQNQQPDTAISVFNSPFGPDALVVTDKLSEGIDLHRYCRHLIHYELDPSPIRTVQRNGRLRRVNSWAALTGKPILYAYPAFRGTRDHRVVQIMKKRIDSFSLLLGGVQDFDVDDVVGSEEKWRNDVIALAKVHLAKAGGALRARGQRKP
ncbi:MAG: SNF2-related protein [Polyangia bacterium]